MQPPDTYVDLEQNYGLLSGLNSILENCDPADPACSESPCDPADPAPACHTETDWTDGVDNDGDDAIDGEDADCVLHREIMGRLIVPME